MSREPTTVGRPNPFILRGAPGADGLPGRGGHRSPVGGQNGQRLVERGDGVDLESGPVLGQAPPCTPGAGPGRWWRRRSPRPRSSAARRRRRPRRRWLSMVPVAATVCPPVTEPAGQRVDHPEGHGQPGRRTADVGHVDVDRERVGVVDLVLGLDPEVEATPSDHPPRSTTVLLRVTGTGAGGPLPPFAHGEGHASAPSGSGTAPWSGRRPSGSPFRRPR